MIRMLIPAVAAGCALLAGACSQTGGAMAPSLSTLASLSAEDVANQAAADQAAIAGGAAVSEACAAAQARLAAVRPQGAEPGGEGEAPSRFGRVMEAASQAGAAASRLGGVGAMFGVSAPEELEAATLTVEELRRLEQAVQTACAD